MSYALGQTPVSTPVTVRPSLLDTYSPLGLFVSLATPTSLAAGVGAAAAAGYATHRMTRSKAKTALASVAALLVVAPLVLRQVGAGTGRIVGG